MGKNARTQTKQEPLADPIGEVVVAEGEQTTEERETEIGQHNPRKTAEVLGYEDLVDQ